MPSHREPAGHALQLVRVVGVPPDVNEPGGQRSHAAASFALNRLSAPHAVQFDASLADAVPARHGAHDDAPPSACVPGAHAVVALEPSHE